MNMPATESDQCLHAIENIETDSELAGAQVGLAIHDGVATLYGCVTTREQKLAAERAVFKVEGITAVAVDLVEKGCWPHPPTDTDIAHAVVECIRRECAPGANVHAYVEEACVTLRGEVDLFYQRDALERAVVALEGVKVVVNRLSVRPPEAQADIDAKVRSSVVRDLANLNPERASGRRPGERESSMQNAGKILIIDDDADYRASLRPVLEGAGYEVFEAPTGRDGLLQVVKQEPDAIVLDVMMETGDEGYGVTHVMKYRDEYQKYRNTPIVMVSSIQETPAQRFPRSEELAMIEPDAYLTKPIDFDRLLEVLKRAVARKRHV